MTIPPDGLYLGDCLDLLPAVPDGSVQLAFADPPFNIGHDYDTYDDRLAPADYLDWTRAWAALLVRTLAAEGSLWVAIGDEYAAEVRLIIHRELGMTPRDWVIWHYSFGQACRRKFARSHTHLMHFVRDPRRFTFHGDAVRVRSARQAAGDRRANPAGKIPVDVWTVNRVCGTHAERLGVHGCQMPEQVLARIIRVSSRPGDLVLDPFAGTGTSLCVARKLGRRFIGFELSPAYGEAIEARLVRSPPGAPIHGEALDSGVTAAPP